jgi:hypothetical protein
MRLVTIFSISCLLLAMAMPASAGPVTVDGPWYEFAFGGPGSLATEGSGTVPSSGGNSVYADDPPWTFAAGAPGVNLTVTDAFLYGDVFKVLDNAVVIGTTSTPGPLGDSGNSDPEVAILDPDMSHGMFYLAPGLHSITIYAIVSPYGGGAGFFRAATAPVPGALLLVGTGLLGLLPWRRRAAP